MTNTIHTLWQNFKTKFQSLTWLKELKLRVVLPSGKTIINPNYVLLLIVIACRYLWKTIKSNPDYLLYWANFTYMAFLIALALMHSFYMSYVKGKVHWILGIEGPRSIGIFRSSKYSPTIVKDCPHTIEIIINKAKDVKETQDPSSKTLKKTYLTVFFGEGDTAKDAKKSRERLLFAILKFKSFQSCDFLLLSAEGR